MLKDSLIPQWNFIKELTVGSIIAETIPFSAATGNKTLGYCACNCEVLVLPFESYEKVLK